MFGPSQSIRHVRINTRMVSLIYFNLESNEPKGPRWAFKPALFANLTTLTTVFCILEKNGR